MAGATEGISRSSSLKRRLARAAPAAGKASGCEPLCSACCSACSSLRRSCSWRTSERRCRRTPVSGFSRLWEVVRYEIPQTPIKAVALVKPQGLVMRRSEAKVSTRSVVALCAITGAIALPQVGHTAECAGLERYVRSCLPKQLSRRPIGICRPHCSHHRQPLRPNKTTSPAGSFRAYF